MPSHEERWEEQLAEDNRQKNSSADAAADASQPIPLNLPAAAAGIAPVRAPDMPAAPAPQPAAANNLHSYSDSLSFDLSDKRYAAYTIKLPADQLAALQSIWLELKRLYGAHSPDKSGMIQQAIGEWLRRWDGPERTQLLQDLLEIRQDTRRRQYKK